MILTYDQLKTAIGNWLDESSQPNITTDAETFIQLAESYLEKEPRIRRPTTQVIVADAPSITAPATFKSLIEVWHAGPNQFFELDTVSVAQLSEYKSRYGLTGIPRAIAVEDQNTFHFGPEPNNSFNLTLDFWETIPRLGGITQSNWLLERSPDIYLYACLVEAAPFFKDDARVSVWATLREERIEALNKDTQAGRWSGKLVQRPRPTIGG